MHQFLPAQANVPIHVLDVWADKIEEESGGRIEIQRFPAMQLGGTPPELYDQAVDGIADIVWTAARLHARPVPADRGVRAAVHDDERRGASAAPTGSFAEERA